MSNYPTAVHSCSRNCFALLSVLLFTGLSLAASQFPDMTPHPPTMNGTVWALGTSPSGSIYVGGNFSNAGSILAENIARWDGSEWHALAQGESAGLHGNVQVIAAFSDQEVYVGGTALESSPFKFGGLTIWNGKGWNTAAGFLEGKVLSIAIQGPRVFVGGDYLRPDNQRKVSLAAWNRFTHSWEEVPAISPDECPVVDRLAVMGQKLFAIASCKSKYGGRRGRLFKREGNNWLELLPDVGVSHTIIASANRLYLSGWFQRLGSRWFTGTAYHTGSGWQMPNCHGARSATVGAPPFYGFSVINAMTADKTTIYFAGSYTTPIARSVSGVIKCETKPGRWALLEGEITMGMDGFPHINTLLIGRDHSLYAGGGFSRVGTLDANGIAMWDGKVWRSLQEGLNNKALVQKFYQDHPELK